MPVAKVIRFKPLALLAHIFYHSHKGKGRVNIIIAYKLYYSIYKPCKFAGILAVVYCEIILCSGGNIPMTNTCNDVGELSA